MLISRRNSIFCVVILTAAMNGRAAEATKDRPMTVEQAYGSWKLQNRAGAIHPVLRFFSPGFTDISVQSLHVETGRVEFHGDNSMMGAKLEVRDDVRSGLSGGLVFDLERGGRDVQGAMYMRDSGLELRFPASCTCSRSGTILRFDKDDATPKRGIPATLHGKLVRSPNAYLSEIPFFTGRQVELST